MGVADLLGVPQGHALLRSIDGHQLRSANEVIVDSFLHVNSIPHEVDGLITPGGFASAVKQIGAQLPYPPKNRD